MDRVASFGVPELEVEYVERPSIRWKAIAGHLIDSRNWLLDVACRSDGAYGSYNDEQRAFAQKAALHLGQDIGEAMKEVHRWEAVNEAAGEEQRIHQEAFFESLKERNRS
jgi:hypothetical protein